MLYIIELGMTVKVQKVLASESETTVLYNVWFVHLITIITTLITSLVLQYSYKGAVDQADSRRIFRAGTYS